MNCHQHLHKIRPRLTVLHHLYWIPRDLHSSYAHRVILICNHGMFVVVVFSVWYSCTLCFLCSTKREYVGDIAMDDSKLQPSSISSLQHHRWIVSMDPQKGCLPQRISGISIDDHIRSSTVPAWASTFTSVYRSDVASSSSSAPVSFLSTAIQHQQSSSQKQEQQYWISSSTCNRSTITKNQDVQSLLSPYTTKMCQWLLDVWLWCEHWYYHCLKHTTYKVYINE